MMGVPVSDRRALGSLSILAQAPPHGQEQLQHYANNCSTVRYAKKNSYIHAGHTI